jgi:hypothetical protein
LQRAPATNPATSNQFTPPESNNDLFPPPGINNGLPVGASPGYQSSTPAPQNTRWARANPNRASGSPTSNTPASAGSTSLAARPTGATTIPTVPIQSPYATTQGTTAGNPSNIQLTSGSQPWQSSPTNATALGATAAGNPPTNQIRIVPSTPSSSAAAGGDPTDIMNLPPKDSSLGGSEATM